MAAYPTPQNTVFVGRDTELNDIAELTNNPLCRLLTLTGPGGIGKTRLAMEVARRQNTAFPDGFCLIPLQRLHSHEFIISAMVESLQCPISPNRDLLEELLEYLCGKSLLLVTDNFEHLLEGVHLLSDILAHAPQVKILTTSRERLNIVEEWVYEVGGLSFPINEREMEIEVFSAVQLFVQNAQRLHHSFALTPECKPAVIRICRLVGGMPLGIELASAWVRVLPCEVIADEIERSLDILETTSGNMTPRHRNMRAAFEPTWNRLTEIERDVFRKLSVFRGSLTLDAARVVAGATRPVLRSLIDKSLLRVDSTGRYSLHELLRQYGQEQLGLLPKTDRDTRDLHAHYYMDFLREREQDLVMRGAHTQAVELMLLNLDNVRLAWEHAVRERWLGKLTGAMEGYWGFHCMRGSSREGAGIFHATAHILRKTTNVQTEVWQRLIALALACEGLCSAQFDSEKARALAEESMTLLNGLPLGKEHLIATHLAIDIAANDSERLMWIEEALKISKTGEYGWWLPKTLVDLGQLARKRGDEALAKKYYDEILATPNSNNNPAAVVLALQGLGLLMMRKANYDAAKGYFEQALKFAYEIQYSAAWWWLHSGLGDSAILQGDYEGAKAQYKLAIQIGEDTQAPYARVFGLSGLAAAALGLGDNYMARQYLAEALGLAQALKGPGALLDVLATGACLLLRTGDEDAAIRFAQFILVQPETEEIARAKMWQLCGISRKESYENAEGLTLETAVQKLRQALSSLSKKANHTPLDMLTKREIEVLVYLAEGLSNYEIAVRLFVGVSTVKTHVNRIFSKLRVKNRTQAVARGRELHLL